MKFIEFHYRIKKKLSISHQNHENYENLIIITQNQENHEIHRRIY